MTFRELRVGEFFITKDFSTIQPVFKKTGLETYQSMWNEMTHTVPINDRRQDEEIIEVLINSRIFAKTN